MKGKAFLLGLVVILILLSGSIYTETQAKKWTIMVYLDADNNLEAAGLDDFLEISMVGSTSDFDVIVQLDCYSTSNAYGWSTCKRFHVTPGMTPTAANAISDIGEVNMGDPDTLIDFCKWTHDNYPSDNYFLIFWDHGDGWRSLEKLTKGACTDDHGTADPDDPTDPYYLNFSNGEIQAALSEITTYFGKDFGVIGFDVCLDGMWENAVACEPYASAFVASEMSEWGEGWSYWYFLDELDTASGNFTPVQLANSVVDAYANGDNGSNGSDPNSTGDTLSAIDLTKIPALTSAIDTLAQELMCAKDAGYTTAINSAREATFQEDSYSYYRDQIDLYDLCLNLQAASVPQSVKDAAAAVNTAVTAAVTNNFADSDVPDNHGIAICYAYRDPYETEYNNLEVATLTYWDNFLKGEGCPVPLLLSYSSHTTDDSSGNGNGSVDPGETINMD
ncbi:MAG: clostripain-related cysteine peptidase, partial [bacterium]|nr:clostripain-related cysteine peptidase [bacterium]